MTEREGEKEREWAREREGEREREREQEREKSERESEQERVSESERGRGFHCMQTLRRLVLWCAGVCGDEGGRAGPDPHGQHLGGEDHDQHRHWRPRDHPTGAAAAAGWLGADVVTCMYTQHELVLGWCCFFDGGGGSTGGVRSLFSLVSLLVFQVIFKN